MSEAKLLIEALRNHLREAWLIVGTKDGSCPIEAANKEIEEIKEKVSK